jgi:hypothetical protein
VNPPSTSIWATRSGLAAHIRQRHDRLAGIHVGGDPRFGLEREVDLAAWYDRYSHRSRFAIGCAKKLESCNLFFSGQSQTTVDEDNRVAS